MAVLDRVLRTPERGPEAPRRARAASLAVLGPVGLVVLVLSIAASTAIGAADLGPRDVLSVVLERLGGPDTGLSTLRERIILDLRLPRAVLAAACGAGLALCGVVLQSLLRNPLADPFVLGVSSGASTGAVLVVVVGIGAGTIGLATGAFLGALVAFSLVLLLGLLTGGTTDRMILAGVASTQLFAALTSFIVFTLADAEQTRGVLFWLLGSLGAATWNEVLVCGLVVLVGMALCWASAGTLDAFMFGQDAAASLGVPVQRVRIVLLVTTALVTAVIVSVSGAIGFVGLVLPHVARALVGVGHRLVVPTAALLGAIFLVWVEVASRTVIAPQELPIGVATALVGVPAFVVVLVRSRRRTS